MGLQTSIYFLKLFNKFSPQKVDHHIYNSWICNKSKTHGPAKLKEKYVCINLMEANAEVGCGGRSGGASQGPGLAPPPFLPRVARNRKTDSCGG